MISRVYLGHPMVYVAWTGGLRVQGPFRDAFLVFVGAVPL